MKKCTVLALVAFIAAMLAAPVTAQESGSDELGLRIGAYGFGELPANEYSQSIDGLVCGGLTIGYPFPAEILGNQFGISFHIQGGYLFAQGGKADNGWDALVMTNLWFRIGLPAGFALVPELGYGVDVRHVDVKPEYETLPSDVYADQLIEAALSFRWAPVKLNGHLEFELTPQFLFNPFNDGMTILGGLRLGFVYAFSK